MQARAEAAGITFSREHKTNPATGRLILRSDVMMAGKVGEDGFKLSAVNSAALRRLAALPPREPREAMSVEAMAEREAKRVSVLLRRDRTDAKAEQRRLSAEDELDAGKFDNIADAVLLPTREQLRHGEFEPHQPDRTAGTIRSAPGMKRVTPARIVQLHARGVLTDDTYPAVLWYRRTWEKTGFDTILSASAMTERSAGGERAYGHMARTAIELEARFNLHFAASFIPADMLGTFDRVVLEEMTITDAARAARCRYANVTAVVKLAATRLLGGIAHLLPVRAVGAPGSSPVVLSEPEPADFEAAAHQPGAVVTADPKFLDARGYMRPWHEIVEILRGATPTPDTTPEVGS
jgi:hypothetical protein